MDPDLKKFALDQVARMDDDEFESFAYTVLEQEPELENSPLLSSDREDLMEWIKKNLSGFDIISYISW